jgi:predicted GIY-YIG superfamily endonuclease
MAGVTWHVYQFRSETSELLYVGYSRWLTRRISTHRREKSWWPEVAHISSEAFFTEEEARQREKEIWASEQPKYNRQSPFLTPEEIRFQKRARNTSSAAIEYRREYNKSEKARDAQHKYSRTAKRLAVVRRYRARRWQQSGPGLF